VPLRLRLCLAGVVFPSLGCGEAEGRRDISGFECAGFRIVAEIADQRDAVHRLHEIASIVIVALPRHNAKTADVQDQAIGQSMMNGRSAASSFERIISIEPSGWTSNAQWKGRR
jgi:hypothetical protein